MSTLTAASFGSESKATQETQHVCWGVDLEYELPFYHVILHRRWRSQMFKMTASDWLKTASLSHVWAVLQSDRRVIFACK